MSASINFPDPRTHQFTEWVLFGDFYYNARDIVGFGGDLTVANLKNAYSSGIFPWHIDRLPLPWFCPEQRAILEFSELHLPRTLRKECRRNQFNISIDRDFGSVIEKCAEVKRSHESGTWITDDFVSVYKDFHRAGWAHSVEVWDGEELVGGLYGIDAGGVFCGESMFHLRSNTSKFALLFLIDHLEKRGSTWIDIQVMTPHFESLGAREIERVEFLDKLQKTQALKLNLFP